VTSWGRDGEFRMVEQYIQRELIDRQLPPGVPKLAACVADSYDVYNFAHQVSTGRLKEMIKGSGGTFVLRPDSGDPVKVLMGILGTLSQNFGDEVRTNSKGFRVLPDYFRLIWGDGIDRNAIRRILESMYIWGWSASNIAFGSGGGLLQKWNRDDQKWKLACSSITVDGETRPVSKDPVTDPGKRSRAGRLDVVRNSNNGEIEVVELREGRNHYSNSLMNTVFENGEILYHTTLAECRERMAL
jgi:nicotinamide phosphoribosyltransferase